MTLLEGGRGLHEGEEEQGRTTGSGSTMVQVLEYKGGSLGEGSGG